MNNESKSLVYLLGGHRDIALLESKPELLEFYEEVCNFDYYYEYSDCLSTWRARMEQEKVILAKIKELGAAKHPDAKIFRKIISLKGDVSELRPNRYTFYKRQLQLPKRANLRFLMDMDRRGFTVDDLKRVVRVMGFINAMISAKPDLMEDHPYYPSLIWSKLLGSKAIGEKFVNKISVSDALTRAIQANLYQVELEDFKVTNQIIHHIGLDHTNHFSASEVYGNYAYLGNYHFVVSDRARRSLASIKIDHRVLRDLRLFMEHARCGFTPLESTGK